MYVSILFKSSSLLTNTESSGATLFTIPDIEMSMAMHNTAMRYLLLILRERNKAKIHTTADLWKKQAKTTHRKKAQRLSFTRKRKPKA